MYGISIPARNNVMQSIFKSGRTSLALRGLDIREIFNVAIRNTSNLARYFVIASRGFGQSIVQCFK
jgi:hypothetical protein